MCLETPGNNSRHVYKCCTAGLGNSLLLNRILLLWLLLYYGAYNVTEHSVTRYHSDGGETSRRRLRKVVEAKRPRKVLEPRMRGLKLIL